MVHIATSARGIQTYGRQLPSSFRLHLTMKIKKQTAQGAVFNE